MRFRKVVDPGQKETDLIWEGELPQAIRALDTTNHVLHIGSFSKNLSPALRLGNLVAPREVMSRVLACKTDIGTGALEQMVVSDFFHRHYAEHLKHLRAGLRRKLGVLTAALQDHFGSSAEFTRPPGGIFLWVKFPEGVDTRKLVEPALREGVAFNPGPEWSVEPEAARN